MKKIFIIILLAPCVAFGQNLIQNPIFENTSGLATPHISFGLKIYIEGWKGFGTVDYYHYNNYTLYPCRSTQYRGMPQSGDSYIGFVIFGTHDQKGTADHSTIFEIVQAELNQKLEHNKKYEITFYIRLSNHYYASKYFGVYFSNESDFANCNISTMLGSFIEYDRCYDSDFTADIEITDYKTLTDTTWTEIKAVYTARGGEKYVNFGLFWLENDKISKVHNKANEPIYNVGKYIRSRKKLPRVIAKEILIKNPHRIQNGNKCFDTKERNAYYYIDNVSVIEVEQ